MTLEKLQEAMIIAMKSHDKIRKDTIASLISSAKKASIDKKCKNNITEELVNEVILKEKKTVQEMIDTCPTDRDVLLREYKTRLSTIEEFAPKLLADETEIKEIVTVLLSENNVEALKKNKGQVMKIVMPTMKGKTDMKIVNKVIGEMLV